MASIHSSFTLNPDGKPSTDPRRNPFKDEETSSAFTARLEDAMEYWHVPGFTIGIIDEHFVTCRGYGVSKAQGGDPVTPKTLWNCASMSKSFTAAGLALLVEEEALKDVNWETPVQKLCEEFVVPGEGGGGVSIEDVLCHRSGLPGQDESLRGINHPTPDTPQTVTLNLRNLSTSHPLRTAYQYNNLLYTAASHLITHLTSTPFSSFLQTRFWDPLSMKRTYLGLESVPDVEKDTLAQGHIYLPKAQNYHEVAHNPDPAGHGCGEIISNVEDWTRWVHAFLHRSPSILSPSSYTELAKPRILAEEPSSSSDGDDDEPPPPPFFSPEFYALGWGVEYYHGHTVISHGGSWAGFVSSMYYIPSKKWGFVTFGNAEDADYVRAEVGWRLVDEVLGVKEEDRVDWRKRFDRVVEKRRKEAEERDADVVGTVFEEVKKRRERGEEVKLADNPASLEAFAGDYESKGYHELPLKWNEEAQCLEADLTLRSAGFWIRIREHAYDLWYVAEIVFVDWPEDPRYVKCQFALNGDGRCEKVGIAICDELEELIWFERVG